MPGAGREAVGQASGLRAPAPSAVTARLPAAACPRRRRGSGRRRGRAGVAAFPPGGSTAEQLGDQRSGGGGHPAKRPAAFLRGDRLGFPAGKLFLFSYASASLGFLTSSELLTK